MIRLFINGLAASAGGGLTYLRNVIPHLARRVDTETTVLLNPAIRREFGELPNISFVETAETSGVFRRVVREQTTLPKLIRRSGAQVLISAGNFALWNSPVPQILLSRNSLYTSGDFLRDVRARGDYAIWADTFIKGWIARRSIRCADITIAPSEAFAQELSQWSGRKIISVHHGFDPDAFTSDAAPLPSAAKTQLEQGKDALRLLFVSHYNYYRNFETLFRAMPILSSRLKGKKVKLFLTCRLNSGDNPGTYRAEALRPCSQMIFGSQDIRRARNDSLSLASSPLSGLPHLCDPSLCGIVRASVDRVDVERLAGSGVGFAGASRNLRRCGNLFSPFFSRCVGGTSTASSGIAGVGGKTVEQWLAACPRLQLEQAC